MNAFETETRSIKKQKTIFLILIILLILIFAVGISYALYEIITEGAKENKIQSGSITFLYTENDNAISITNASDTNDTQGKISENYFNFSLTGSGTGNTKLSYYIYFTVDNTTTLNLNSVKLYLTKTDDLNTPITNEVVAVNPAPVSSFVPFNLKTLQYDENSNNYLLYTNAFTFNNSPALQIHYYRFRMWLNNTGGNSITISGTGDNDTNHQAIITGGTFKLKINIYGINGDLNPITFP